MKKTAIALLLLLSALCLAACGEATHTHLYNEEWQRDADVHWKSCTVAECMEISEREGHRWGTPVLTKEPTEAAVGEEVYTCSVCGYEMTRTVPVLVHSHSLLSEWHSDNSSHWLPCTGCVEKREAAEHQWKTLTVLEAPTSEKAGKQQVICEVCGRSTITEIPKLPDKMSELDWRAAFTFQNLRTDVVMKSDDEVEVGCYLMDGDLVLSLDSEGQETFCDRESVMPEIDFSDSYDLFDHYGDGVYICRSMTRHFVEDGLELTLEMKEVTVIFCAEGIRSISYQLDMAMLGTYDLQYQFSQWALLRSSCRSLRLKGWRVRWTPSASLIIPWSFSAPPASRFSFLTAICMV